MNLSNLQLDNQKKILIVIFCVLIVYLDMTFILKSQSAGIKSLDPKIISLRRDLANLNQELLTMRAAQGRQSLSAQKNITKPSTKIISDGQISGLLQDIASLANKLDIKIGQIRPSRETVNVRNTKNAAIDDKFTPVLINLDLICDYHNLGKFINELEGGQVFLGVQELKISTQIPDYMKQKITLVLKTYVTK